MILLCLEFIISLKVYSSWFALFKLRSMRGILDKWLAIYKRIPPAFDSFSSCECKIIIVKIYFGSQ